MANCITNLFEGFEIDLIIFDYQLSGEYCESMAQEFHVWFRVDPDTELKTAGSEEGTGRGVLQPFQVEDSGAEPSSLCCAGARVSLGKSEIAN